MHRASDGRNGNYWNRNFALAIWIGAILVNLAMIPLGLLSDWETNMAHLRTPAAVYARADQPPLH
jgi:hypothetical protein